MAKFDETKSAPRNQTLLGAKLAEQLPTGAAFTIYHISTPPTKHEDIFAARGDKWPEKTFCERHLLSVAIAEASTGSESGHEGRELLVFAVEVFLYTTAQLTTIFVSKADSTGYLHQLDLPKGSASPLKSICSTFLSYLVQERRRPGIKLLVSLFARAQDQYLFPGSAESPSKHVLNDRALIRWWCRVLDPLTRTAARVRSENDSPCPPKAYVIVPGLDKFETAALFPPSTRVNPAEAVRWTNGHPLQGLSHSPGTPPRCLIPRFPDDPKARYMDELDEELPEISYNHFQDQFPKKGNAGFWKSVQTLDQFWDAMEFRQECSSGRSVGFIWVVFESCPRDSISRGGSTEKSAADDIEQRPRRDSRLLHRSSRLPKISCAGGSSTGRLNGPIISRPPRVKTSSSSRDVLKYPEISKFFYWPVASRGPTLLNERDFKRIGDLLLRLDFATPGSATQSTQRWVDEVAVIAGREHAWGETVVGIKSTEPSAGSVPAATVNSLNMGLLRRKRKDGKTEVAAEAAGMEDAKNSIDRRPTQKEPKESEPVEST